MMHLNLDTTVKIMNILINCKPSYDSPITLDNGINIVRPKSVKFLGVKLDNHFTFGEHVDDIIASCNPKLYNLCQLKALGMNVIGLKSFYAANTRSMLTYESPAWFSMLPNLDESAFRDLLLIL